MFVKSFGTDKFYIQCFSVFGFNNSVLLSSFQCSSVFFSGFQCTRDSVLIMFQCFQLLFSTATTNTTTAQLAMQTKLSAITTRSIQLAEIWLWQTKHERDHANWAGSDGMGSWTNQEVQIEN